ncbi:carbohydrate-binding protein, partial [bacterium]|nr:carbohydrate-binding protein [bacterium]
MKLFLSILSLIFVLMISSCSGSFDFEDTIFDNENLSNDDNDNSSIICTEEAKICPDGSSVVRVGPNCEFAACPDFEEENKSNQRLVFSSKPKIPMDKIYSINFDKIQNFKGEEISGQGITYSDESFSRNIYRGFNINNTYPQIWPIDLNDTSWKIGSNRVGEWQEYTLDILKSGTYLPKLKMSSLNGPQSNSSFRLYLNGNFLMDLNTYKTGSWNTWEIIEYAPINLSLGENQILRVEVLSSGSDWHSLWFEEYTPKDEVKKLELSLEASSTSINSGESVTLTWTSINANSCTGTGFSTGGKTSGSIKV